MRVRVIFNEKKKKKISHQQPCTILEKIQAEVSFGLTRNEEYQKWLRCLDDTLIAESKEELKSLLMKVRVKTLA